jgi:diguanylate cyclase (GGDEF)-like protein
MERRQSQCELLAQLDRRTWRLWVLALSVSFTLAFGVALYFFPVLAWRVRQLDAGSAILPQLITGLLVLVALQSVYVILKQKQVNEMREFIISQYVETGTREDLAQDPLTGALDRRTLPDIMQRERAWADRFHLPLCLVLVDIRGFREINDQGGHLAGDIILKDLAHIIQTTVRQTDTVMRYGSDEFLCFLSRTDQTGGEGFTRRLSKRCKEVTRLASVSLDFGVAAYKAGMTPDVVVADVERRLDSNRASMLSTSA